jgi:probable phosphoglycerate mutase
VTHPAPERQIWLVRHGETEWALNGRHTGSTDIPLTETGRQQAEALGRRLAGRPFALILTSPLSRAAETARLSGFGDRAQLDPDLREWDYGAFEGLTTPEIRATRPDWTIWSGPWVDGESPDQVGARADRIIDRCLDPAVEGDALVFAHGHFLRVLAARWIGLPAAGGGKFALSTATLGLLGWDRANRVIELWNEGSHLEP